MAHYLKKLYRNVLRNIFFTAVRENWLSDENFFSIKVWWKEILISLCLTKFPLPAPSLYSLPLPPPYCCTIRRSKP